MRSLLSILAVLLAAFSVVLGGIDHRHVREVELVQVEHRDRLGALELDKEKRDHPFRCGYAQGLMLYGGGSAAQTLPWTNDLERPSAPLLSFGYPHPEDIVSIDTRTGCFTAHPIGHIPATGAP